MADERQTGIPEFGFTLAHVRLEFYESLGGKASEGEINQKPIMLKEAR
jgi:hypothetical protein